MASDDRRKLYRVVVYATMEDDPTGIVAGVFGDGVTIDEARDIVWKLAAPDAVAGPIPHGDKLLRLSYTIMRIDHMESMHTRPEKPEVRH